MNEETFDAKQSLQLIESMINRAKDRFAEDGYMYLVWGWLVFACGVGQFLLLHVFHYSQHYIVWMAAWLVALYQVVYVRRKRRKEQVRTYTGYIIAYVWVTFGIVIFLLAFLIGQLTSDEYYAHIIPIILSVYGMPVFLSGIILRFKPLVTGGIACWALCVLSTLVRNYDYQFLLIPLAMLIAWIVPGYLLRKKYKLQTV